MIAPTEIRPLLGRSVRERMRDPRPPSRFEAAIMEAAREKRERRIARDNRKPAVCDMGHRP